MDFWIPQLQFFNCLNYTTFADLFKVGKLVWI